MKHQNVRILAIIMLVIALSSVGAHALSAEAENSTYRYLIPKPTMSFLGNQAICDVTLRIPGQSIDATLELWQGSTLVASWSDCKTGVVSLSGNATVTSGLTYTLTVSGTIGGVPFTPVSTTKTP